MSDNGQLYESPYNNIPVAYCKRCLSLKILKMDDTCYCDKCGSMEIDEEPIFIWIKRYELKYDRKFFDVERIRRLKKLW